MHHLTVDVEEFFHASAVQPHLAGRPWSSLRRRAPDVVDRLLAALAAHDTRATFFVLGWLARREPRMVRAIADAGHEVASHGRRHRLVASMTPDEFRGSVADSRRVLEDITGPRVEGYRAPSFSIGPDQRWALRILVEEGYRYDSSLVPVTQHPSYGFPCPPDPHWLRFGPARLLEVPPATVDLGGTRWPAGGGAYFRFFSHRLVALALEQAERRGSAATFYIHPWELDDPRLDVPLPAAVRLRTFGFATHSWDRLSRLLGRFRFGPVRETLRAMEARRPLAPVPAVAADLPTLAPPHA